MDKKIEPLVIGRPFSVTEGDDYIKTTVSGNSLTWDIVDSLIKAGYIKDISSVVETDGIDYPDFSLMTFGLNFDLREVGKVCRSALNDIVISLYARYANSRRILYLTKDSETLGMYAISSYNFDVYAADADFDDPLLFINHEDAVRAAKEIKANIAKFYPN